MTFFTKRPDKVSFLYKQNSSLFTSVFLLAFCFPWRRRRWPGLRTMLVRYNNYWCGAHERTDGQKTDGEGEARTNFHPKTALNLRDWGGEPNTDNRSEGRTLARRRGGLNTMTGPTVKQYV